MKISRRKLKSLIESVLNEVENQSVSYKSAAQEELEKELADLNKKAIDAIEDEATKRKVRDSIKKLMGRVDKAEFNDAKQIALNVYAGELGNVDTTLKGKLQVYDKNAVAILGKLRKLVSDEKQAKEVEDAAASSKPKAKPKPKKKGLSTSAKDKVKKIQVIIGASADGSWGPKTTTAWKTWIVSDRVKNALKDGYHDNTLTPDYLESNKGKAAVIAKKAGYSADLDGVLDFVNYLVTQISADVDDEDYGEIADSIAPGEYVADGNLEIDSVPIYSVTVKADGKVTYVTDYDGGQYSQRLSNQQFKKAYTQQKMQASSGTKPSKEDIFSEIEAGNSLKRDETGTGPLQETKIRRMIRQIVLENLRKA